MPPRANWKGYLRLSLVSCPIALYPASSLSEKVSFNRINRRTGNRLKQQNVDSETGEEVPREDIARGENRQLVLTRAVVDEALRLYPSSFVIVREAIADDVVEGVRAPAGSLIMIAPWVLHRHRALWPEPERFDPARFLAGAPPPDRFAYLPFGIGPRTCIGSSFALTELVLVLAILIRAFHIELIDRRPVVLR